MYIYILIYLHMYKLLTKSLAQVTSLARALPLRTRQRILRECQRIQMYIKNVYSENANVYTCRLKGDGDQLALQTPCLPSWVSRPLSPRQPWPPFSHVSLPWSLGSWLERVTRELRERTRARHQPGRRPSNYWRTVRQTVSTYTQTWCYVS